MVLQLALAIDYAIIFCHRYMEEQDNGLDAREADMAALSKAIVEISSSSLTTISGLVALMLMQLKIGFGHGHGALQRALFAPCSRSSFLMPGLLMLFNQGIERPGTKFGAPHHILGQAVVKPALCCPSFSRWWVGGFFCSSQCDVCLQPPPIRATSQTPHRRGQNQRRLRRATPSPCWSPGGLRQGGPVLRRVECPDRSPGRLGPCQH